MEIITDVKEMERNIKDEYASLKFLFAGRIIEYTYVGKFFQERDKAAYDEWRFYVDKFATKTIDSVVQSGNTNNLQTAHYVDVIILSGLMMMDGVFDPNMSERDIVFTDKYKPSMFAIQMMDQAITESISYDSKGTELFYKVYEEAVTVLKPSGLLIFKFKFDYLIRHDFGEALEEVFDTKGASGVLEYVLNRNLLVFQSSILKAKDGNNYINGTYNDQSRFYIAGIPLSSKREYFHVSWMLEKLAEVDIAPSPRLVRIVENAYNGFVDMNYGDDLNEYESESNGNFEDGEFIFSVYTGVSLVEESYDLIAYILNQKGPEILGTEVIDGKEERILAIPTSTSVKRFVYSESNDRIALLNYNKYLNVPELIIIPKTLEKGQSDYNYQDFIDKFRDLKLFNEN